LSQTAPSHLVVKSHTGLGLFRKRHSVQGALEASGFKPCSVLARASWHSFGALHLTLLQLLQHPLLICLAGPDNETSPNLMDSRARSCVEAEEVRMLRPPSPCPHVGAWRISDRKRIRPGFRRGDASSKFPHSFKPDSRQERPFACSCSCVKADNGVIPHKRMTIHVAVRFEGDSDGSRDRKTVCK